MSHQITIVGLGPAALNLVPQDTIELLRTARLVILRTGRHPAAEELSALGVTANSCDDLYETKNNFEDVYSAVVQRVLDAAMEGPVVYAVPGDPLVAERTVQGLLQAARNDAQLQVQVVPALGALNVILARLQVDPGDGMLILDARDPQLRPANEAPAISDHDAYHGAQPRVNPTLPTLWFQVDTPLVASDLKVILLEQYPPEHRVTVLTAVGAADEQVTEIPLEELDREVTINHLTSLFVPVLSCAQRRHTVTDLRAIMALLRAPGGCPWDREQDMLGMRRTIIEEAYETVEAIEKDDPENIAEELGDLLLNIIFVAQLGAEEGVFDLDDVAGTLADKLIRRHAHVFGQVEADTAGAVLQSWEKIKAGERAEKGEHSIFDDVPQALPALSRAQKLQKRAARVGFDWPDYRGPLQKLHEELGETQEELGIMDRWDIPTLLADPLAPMQDLPPVTADPVHLTHEVGDILFAAVNLARFLHLDAEEVLREANARFVRRFTRVEEEIKRQGSSLEKMTVAQMDAVWVSIKGED